MTQACYEDQVYYILDLALKMLADILRISQKILQGRHKRG